MGRLTGFLLFASIALSGCTVMTTAAAIPGFLVEGVFGHFQGTEESYPVSMRTALAASQNVLREMKLDADLLEPQEKGNYVILFGNDRIDGQIALSPQTPELTTFYVKVKNGMSRQESVERAILEELHKTVDHISRRARFDFRGYDQIREQPDKHAAKLAWFRNGASLAVKPAGKKHPGWLQIKLPSKKIGYLTGHITKPSTAKQQ